jgi:hypothetical protein
VTAPGSDPREQPGFWTPRPDPTVLTTDAVERATAQFRREMQQLRELIETRLDCADAALANHLREMETVRHQIEEKITHLRELAEEKFDSIDRRFDDRDARAGDAARAGKEALAAALESARQLTELQNRANKELSEAQDKANQAAITKAQGATNEQIKALDQVSGTNRKALEDKIDDARTRLTTMESLTRGIKEAGGEQREVRTEQRLNTSQIIAAIATLAAVISLVLYIAKK